MKRLPATLLVSMLLASLAACSAPPVSPRAAAAHFADPDHLLPAETALALDRRLADFARATNRKVFLHLAATSPSDPTGRKINLLVQNLAATLGVASDGVLIFYSADRDEWKLWLGDALLPAVMGRPGTAADFTPDGSLHAKKEELLAPAKKLTAAPFTPAASPVEPPTPRRLAQACDSVLDAIFRALETK